MATNLDTKIKLINYIHFLPAWMNPSQNLFTTLNGNHLDTKIKLINYELVVKLIY